MVLTHEAHFDRRTSPEIQRWAQVVPASPVTNVFSFVLSRETGAW